jgi:hypothetical protein
MKIRAILFIPIFLLITVAAWASTAPDTETIPSSLEEWKPWVLHGKESHFCPTPYNKGHIYRCTWPSRLELDLAKEGGRFTQQWLVFKKGRVPLPGSRGMWPQDVKVDGKSVPILVKENVPSVHMTPGEHSLKGSFAWSEMPEMIRVPEASGLVSLTLNQKTVDFPLLDDKGRLWLQKQKEARTQEERVEVRIYRLLNDEIPMQVTNLLKIDVSGQAREITLGGVLLKGFNPMSINSPLPSRLGPQGELMIQARPGRWEIRILTRSDGPLYKIGPVKTFFGQEIWAFQSQNQLRMVKIQGVPSVDPKQTDSPLQWKKFPTFIIKDGDQMAFKEIRRGDPDPAPDQLHLKRTWWLDFDGKGLTVRDRIKGTMSRNWYLAMSRPGVLGRVSVEGTDQLITAQGKDKRPGVELRRGRLDLVAESRFEASTGTIPAVGWDHDFQSVSGFLNLPPGWRLLTSSGVDVMPGTWFERWTLLDLFIVLIISLAVFKLWNWRWGVLALVTIGLIYHEPGSPRLVWLHLLAATALLRFLPDGWVKKLVRFWRLGSIVTLLVMAIPFMVQQVRWGVYPQLEQHRAISHYAGQQAVDTEVRVYKDEQKRALMKGKKTPSGIRSYARSRVMKDKFDSSQRQTVLVQDPNALIQTGPGLPNWTWRSYNMKWNGPVDRVQQVRLWLFSPAVNLVFSLVGVVLLALLIFVLMDFREWKLNAGNFHLISIVLCMLLFPGLSSGETKRSEYPPKELLQQLEERLLEKPDCLPNCADSPQMELTVGFDGLRILFRVHAAVETAIPLPGSSKSWRPKQVLVDSRPATGLLRDKEGLLWVLVPEGLHTVTLMGVTPPETTFQIPLPLKPHKGIIHSEGWDVQGVDKDGRVQTSIKLTRQKKNDHRLSTRAAMTLAPFLHIERVISLGLDWQVRTTVRRLTPLGTPIVVSVPLIAGESVTTAGISVENGNALIHMDPGSREIKWISTLKQNRVIRLQAARKVPWTETWMLNASPIWHCDLSGIAVIHHQDQEGRWRPQWQPWPGENITIDVSRPKAIAGQTVTIDEAKLTFTPGRRFKKAALSLRIRSSQGGQHKITLPEGAELQLVKIMGKGQPIKASGREVIVPLRPGSQTVDVEWHRSSESFFLTRAPQVGIGREAVNANVIFQMPKNRWILMTAGPPLGPAVLFWSYFVVIILGALGLGRVPWTPLKTRHWLLLGLGLTQVNPLVAIMIVGWLLGLGLRQKHSSQGGWCAFNITQVLLVAWTIAALVGLYFAVQKGLLGIPNMQISGNGSSHFWLKWTQDRIGTTMPEPWVLSLPLFVYRLLMLFWALWLAHSLLKWLRWGWHCFSEGGIWKKIIFKKSRKDKEAITPPPIPSEKGNSNEDIS